MQNSFPMREWHVKNMEKTIIKHVKGLSPDATKFERRMYKRYGGIHKVQMRIKYDIKHGVNNDEVIALHRLSSNQSYVCYTYFNAWLQYHRSRLSHLSNVPKASIFPGLAINY